MTPADFYSQFLPYAQGVSSRTGLDPRLVLAQAALETGYGKSAPNMNFFGIKSHGRKGGQTLQTSEFQNGQMVQQPASFRSYESPEQSFNDYADFLRSNPRYEGVLSAQGLDQQIAEMAKSGYATDPEYGAKLANIAAKFDPSAAPIIAVDTMAALGKKPLGILAPTQTAETESNPMIQEEKPSGLLGSLGIQRMEEGAAGETGQRFYERDTFKDTAATLAQGFAAMGSRPGLQKMAADVAAQRTEGKAKNRTIEYLRKAGRDDLAGAVESGALGVRDAAQILFTQPKDNSTALQKNYQFFISQGMSPEEAMQAVRSGTVINMPDQKGADEFAKLDAKNLASVAEVGMSASRSLAQINRLEQLLSNTQTGAAGALKMFAGNFGINSEGLDDIQAAQAIINSLVPQQRPAGSGPMSDADLELFKQSLPRIINTPQGNTTILETMRGIAQYDAMGAEIIQKYRSDPEFTQADAFAALAARPDPFEAVRPIMTATTSETMSREDALDLLNQ